MDLATTLRWTAERHPDRIAVAGTGRTLTWAAWNARVNRLAGALADAGVGPGDRVALSMTGGEPLASLHLAAQVLGAVSVPLSTRFGPDELAYCLDDSGATLVVTDEAQAHRTEAAAERSEGHPSAARAAIDAARVRLCTAGELDDSADRQPDSPPAPAPARTR